MLDYSETEINVVYCASQQQALEPHWIHLYLHTHWHSISLPPLNMTCCQETHTAVSLLAEKQAAGPTDIGYKCSPLQSKLPFKSLSSFCLTHWHSSIRLSCLHIASGKNPKLKLFFSVQGKPYSRNFVYIFLLACRENVSNCNNNIPTPRNVKRSPLLKNGGQEGFETCCELGILHFSESNVSWREKRSCTAVWGFRLELTRDKTIEIT